MGGGIGGHKDRKQMQMYIPMFLAFNAVGWMMLAMKAVAVLTVKALLVSKLAFIVAATVVVKKMMDSATEKFVLLIKTLIVMWPRDLLIFLCLLKQNDAVSPL